MRMGFFGRSRELSHEQAQEWLSAYLDRQLHREEAGRLESHLQACAGCREELQALRATQLLLRTLPPVRIPRSFTLEAAPRPAPLPGAFFFLRTATAMATTAFVALMAAALVLPLAGAPAGTPAAQRAPQEATEASAPVVAFGAQPEAARSALEPTMEAASAASAPAPEARSAATAPMRAAPPPAQAPAAAIAPPAPATPVGEQSLTELAPTAPATLPKVAAPLAAAPSAPAPPAEPSEAQLHPSRPMEPAAADVAAPALPQADVAAAGEPPVVGSPGVASGDGEPDAGVAGIGREKLALPETAGLPGELVESPQQSSASLSATLPVLQYVAGALSALLALATVGTWWVHRRRHR